MMNTPNRCELEFLTALDVPTWDRLSTGCQRIDTVLKGGIPFNGITEIYGASGVGKTQILLQLAVMIQVPERVQHWGCSTQTTYLSGKARGALYIGTEDVFPSKRYFQLVDSLRQVYNLQEVDFEHNLFISHAADYEQLRRKLSVELPQLLAKKNIGLVIIDSIAGVFRSENENTNYSFRGQEIIDIVHTLNVLSEQYKFVVICSNQVACDKTTGKDEPCLGLAWSNNITYRIEITRCNRNPSRTFKVVFAPDLPNSECSFTITESGISDF